MYWDRLNKEVLTDTVLSRGSRVSFGEELTASQGNQREDGGDDEED